MHKPTEGALETLRELQLQASKDFGLTSAIDGYETAMQLAALRAQFGRAMTSSQVSTWWQSVLEGLEGAQNMERVTPLQDPMDSMIINRVYETMRQRVSKVSNVRFPERVILASLPIGQMNAITIHLPETSEYLVLFQRGLFGILNLLARLISSIWPEDPEQPGLRITATIEELQQNLEARPNLSNELLAILEHALVHGNPHRMPIGPISATKASMKETFLLNAEIFILGHEFGHIERSHFLPSNRVEATCGNSALSIISRTRQEEFAADLTGIQYSTCFGILDPMQIYLGYAGACFFLTCQDLVEKALSLLAGVNDSMRARDTHPTGAQRREALTNVLRSNIGYSQAEILRSAYAPIQWTFDRLWEMTESAWMELGARGTKAAGIWAAAVESQDRDTTAETPFVVEGSDHTPRSMGMPSLRNMESFKDPSFSALFHMTAGQDKESTLSAAEWMTQNAHIAMHCIVSEIAYHQTDRYRGVFELLMEKCPGLSLWFSQLKFVIGRYSDNEDLLGVPEMMLAVISGRQFLAEIAENVLSGTTVDYQRLLLDVEYRTHRGIFDQEPEL